mgnify:CR=1 FL=1
MVKGDSLDSTLESVCCGEKRGKVKKNESSHKNMRIKMHKMYIRLKLLQFLPDFSCAAYQSNVVW